MTVKVTFAGSGDAFGSGGRHSTCILVEAPDICFAIDFGTSSVIALKALEIPHNNIDVILLTHLHGDHCGGVSSLLMDAMLGAKRQTPITIAGPRGTKAHLPTVQEVLFPGSGGMKPKFAVDVIDMDVLTPHDIEGLRVTTYPAIHTEATNPTSMRIEVDGKTIAYTGDSAWTEHIPNVARDADLFISECYFHEKRVPFHMNYPDLTEHADELTAKRTVLTHMGPEMLAAQERVKEECAFDGMVIELEDQA
ncbi:MAG: MBL fold metallo-hydrolase [Hyphomicrobiaceae bacterium]|nr:MBL fold metallo-hydrolase [Hyphomicrobiaceae bacterium]